MKVLSVKPLWRGIYLVTYTRKGWRRPTSDLFRRCNGVWQSGVEHPTGVYSEPLRPAHPAIAAALDTTAHLQSNHPAWR
jgi:hypothetical protein